MYKYFLNAFLYIDISVSWWPIMIHLFGILPNYLSLINVYYIINELAKPTQQFNSWIARWSGSTQL